MSEEALNANDMESYEPEARWTCEDTDTTIMTERIRFPYASSVIAPNRFMKSAMSEQLATYDSHNMKQSGIPTKKLLNLYKKYSDGEYGVIVTGCIMINGKNLEAPGNVIIDKELESDERREAFKEWTEITKKNGSVFIAQLFHPGKHAIDIAGGNKFDVNTVTREQIDEIVEQYAYAASFAQQCGFNGVEISAAYSYALGQFLTVGSNWRTDEYGGSLENRSRILFRIIHAIRLRVRRPSKFAIGLKLFTGNFESGFDAEEFEELIRMIEKTGYDYIAITGGHFNFFKDFKNKAIHETPDFEHFYQAIVLTIKRHLTRTKVYMNGGFVTIADMCDAVRNGWTTGISLARPVAAEPDLPKKMLRKEVKSAVKSLISHDDYSTAQQFAGTQLWQNAMSIIVMDASNPKHVDIFKHDLEEHIKLKSETQTNENDQIIGYPKIKLDEKDEKSLSDVSKERTIETEDRTSEYVDVDSTTGSITSMTKILTEGEDIAKEVSMTKILGDDEGSAQEASMTKILTEGEDIAKEVSMTKILGDDEGSAQEVSMTKILTDGEDIAKEVSMTKILGDDEGSAQKVSMTKILTDGEDIAKEVSMTKILCDDECNAQEVSMTKILTDGEDIAKEVSVTKILDDDEGSAQEVSMTKILTDGEDIAKEVSMTKILGDDEGSAQEVSVTKILTDGENIAKEVSMTKILGDDEGSAQEVSVTKILTDGEDIAKEVSMTKILCDDEGNAQEVSMTKILTDGEDIAKEVSMTKILGDDEGSAQEVSVTKILTDGEDIAKEVSMTKILGDDEGSAQEVSMTKILTDGEDIAKEVSMTKILTDGKDSAQKVSMTKIVTDGEDIAKEVSVTKILTEDEDIAKEASMTRILGDVEDVAHEISATKILTDGEDIVKEISMTKILTDDEPFKYQDATDGKEYNITCGTIEDSSRSTEEAKAKISANNGVFDSTKSSHILGKTNGTYDSTSNEKLSVSAPFDQNQKDYVSKEKSEEISNKQTHIDDAYHHEYTDKYGDQVNYDDEERRMMDYVREDPMLPSHATLFGSMSADEIKEQNGALNEDIKATIEGDSAFQSRQDPKAQDESSANDMYASYHFDSHDVEYTGSTINAHDEKGESISHSITSVLPGAQNFFSTIKGKFDDVMNTMHRKNNKNSSDEYFSNNANELSPDSSSLAMNDPTIINKSEKILNRGEDDDEKFHQETTVISAMTTDSTPVVAGIVSDISISEIAEQNAQSSSADERFHDTESPIGIYFDANENKKILEDNDFEIIH